MYVFVPFFGFCVYKSSIDLSSRYLNANNASWDSLYDYQFVVADRVIISRSWSLLFTFPSFSDMFKCFVFMRYFHFHSLITVNLLYCCCHCIPMPDARKIIYYMYHIQKLTICITLKKQCVYSIKNIYMYYTHKCTI